MTAEKRYIITEPDLRIEVREGRISAVAAHIIRSRPYVDVLDEKLEKLERNAKREKDTAIWEARYLEIKSTEDYYAGYFAAIAELRKAGEQE